MDRIAKFLILLVAALVLVPGCFAEQNATATETTATTEVVGAVSSDVVNNTTLAEVAVNLSDINGTIEANNTTINASMNLTNVSPVEAAIEGVNNTSVENKTTV